MRTEVIEYNEEETDSSSPMIGNSNTEVQRLLGGGDESQALRLPRYGTDSLLVYVLNENLLFGLFVFPKAFQLLDCKDKFIEWWWRFVATIYSLCVVVLLLQMKRVFDVKTPQSTLQWQFEVSVAGVIALQLFRRFRDHYLLWTFNMMNWMGGLKITLLDIGLPFLIIGSFVVAMYSWNSKELLLEWIGAWALTFFLQTLWCAINFLCFARVCGSPCGCLAPPRSPLQKFRLSVSSLSTPEDSPVFMANDCTTQETLWRKTIRITCALCYIIAGLALVGTTLLFIARNQPLTTSLLKNF